MQILTQFAASLVASCVAAGLALLVALVKFRGEKWWERKADVYARLMEALSVLKRDFDESFRDEIEQVTRDEEYRKESVSKYRTAREHLEHQSYIGSFVISDRAAKILADFRGGMDQARDATDYFQHLDTSIATVADCLRDLRAAAKEDLAPSFREMFWRRVRR